jgi:hypothetical protein
MAIQSADRLEDNDSQRAQWSLSRFPTILIESGTGPILASMGAADSVTVVRHPSGSDVPPGNSMVISGGAASRTSSSGIISGEQRIWSELSEFNSRAGQSGSEPQRDS